MKKKIGWKENQLQMQEGKERRERELFDLLFSGEIELWTSSRVAKKMKFTRQYTNLLMRTGKIKSVFINRTWLTIKQNINNYLNK